MKQRYKALRGTKDILPDESVRWQFLEATVRRVFARYGFREMRTPILEATELFARSVGASTEIVSKEMYRLSTGDESVCLRPEGTASVVRAFVEQTLNRQVGTGYPERYFYIGPMFRYERPQKGRQRQFHQFGVEVLGSAEPLVDAETIEMADALLRGLGLTDQQLAINSLGDATCRPAYLEELRGWLEERADELCADCNRRVGENPLRVFDCKVAADQRLLSEAPTILDRLCEPCDRHFAEVRRILDLYELAYRVDPRIVRGLDYYQRTVFEVVSPGLGAQNALLGGGRYDGLVEELGGPAVPGFGFAAGMERILLVLPAERLPEQGVDLALIALGQEGWEAAIALARRLRGAGVGCVMPTIERPMGAQLRRADKAGARFALFAGKDELAAGEFGLKDLRSGDQLTVKEAEIPRRLKEGGRKDE